MTATLKTSSGTPVPNETIGFNFNQNNSNYNAVTDANGVATVIVPLGFTTVGTHPQAFTVTFGGDASFAASSATGDLIVTKAQLTVTANNQSRLYGDPNPPFTYVITGFVNGDDISVVSGAADCTSTATRQARLGLSDYLHHWNAFRTELRVRLCRRHTYDQSGALDRERGQRIARLWRSESNIHGNDHRPEEWRCDHRELHHHGNAAQPGWNLSDHGNAG